MILSKLLCLSALPPGREDMNKLSKTLLFSWKGLKKNPVNLVSQLLKIIYPSFVKSF